MTHPSDQITKNVISFMHSDPAFFRQREKIFSKFHPKAIESIRREENRWICYANKKDKKRKKKAGIADS